MHSQGNSARRRRATPAWATAMRRVDDLRVVAAAGQNARRAVLHDQHGRQHQRRDILQFALDRLGLEAGAGGGSFEQRDRQMAVFNRQPGQQRIAAERASMKRRKKDQRIRKRISLPRGGGRRRHDRTWHANGGGLPNIQRGPCLTL